MRPCWQDEARVSGLVVALWVAGVFWLLVAVVVLGLVSSPWAYCSVVPVAADIAVIRYLIWRTEGVKPR